MEIEVIFLNGALDDLLYWKKSEKKGVQQKITKLIDAIKENPFDGIGKPEPLKHDLSGWWSTPYQ